MLHRNSLSGIEYHSLTSIGLENLIRFNQPLLVFQENVEKERFWFELGLAMMRFDTELSLDWNELMANDLILFSTTTTSHTNYVMGGILMVEPNHEAQSPLGMF